MQVFKFGGASIKDAEAIINMAKIIGSYKHLKLVVVVSAMGKTTNKLEAILSAANNRDAAECFRLIEYLEEEHEQIVNALFDKPEDVNKLVKALFKELKDTIKNTAKSIAEQRYDNVISFGERLSAIIIIHFLKHEGLAAKLIDAHELITTDSNFKEAAVNWEATQTKITERVIADFEQHDVVLSQGFIGGTEKGEITTLGREGSDFTAAIFAYCLQPEAVTIWKDVPGILNADPKKFEDAKLYPELSYQEAAEMTYYGASVIHPKTIKPLANKRIPLHVRSFEHPKEKGTLIHNCQVVHMAPCIILKEKQCLITFSVTDFTFISEQHLSSIFTAISEHHIKINMMQNSAISLSICINDEPNKLAQLMDALRGVFDIRYNENLELITIKNYEEGLISKLRKGRKTYLEQRSRTNFQMVVGW